MFSVYSKNKGIGLTVPILLEGTVDIYTAVQKFGISKICNVFLRESLLLIKAVFIRSKIQKTK